MAGCPSRGYRVTEIERERLISLNGAPAVQAFLDHAETTGQALDTSNPLPFFLHNILGIRGGEGYRLRVPLAVNPDGSISCAAGIPLGSVVHIMKRAWSRLCSPRVKPQSRHWKLGVSKASGRRGIRLRSHSFETRRRTAGLCRSPRASALSRRHLPHLMRTAMPAFLGVSDASTP